MPGAGPAVMILDSLRDTTIMRSRVNMANQPVSPTLVSRILPSKFGFSGCSAPVSMPATRPLASSNGAVIMTVGSFSPRPI